MAFHYTEIAHPHVAPHGADPKTNWQVNLPRHGRRRKTGLQILLFDVRWWIF
jgi:hypothetical protein